MRTLSALLLAALLAAGARAQQPPSGPPRAGPDPPQPDAPLVPKIAPDSDPARPEPEAPRVPNVAEGRAFTQDIAGTVVSIDMVPVAPGLWLSSHEITWDAYDVFVFGLDQPATPPAEGGAPAPDAVLRPTKPHMTADRGWGHAGFPAMSLSAKGAQAFCEWLSANSGRRYRLPTEAEWEAACRAGAPPTAAWSCGDDLSGLAAIAWYKENSEHRTHAVGTRTPNALGLFDMHGNVAEWCLAPDGGAVLRGGSYRDASKALRCDARVPPAATWNQSDPNLPKSVWWLADAPFAGFRIACAGEPDEHGAPRAGPAR